MPNTPVYGWPYQQLADSPDGAALGANLALAVERTVQPIDALSANLLPRVVALEAVKIYRDVQNVVAPVATVTFSAIPSTLRQLRIQFTARGDTAAVDANLLLRVNGDSGANTHRYAYQVMTNSGAPAGAGALNTFTLLGNIPAGTSTAGCFGSGHVDIAGWNQPHAGWLAGTFVTGYVSAAAVNLQLNGSWAYTGAITPYTSLVFSLGAGNFVAGSSFYLEGLP